MDNKESEDLKKEQDSDKDNKLQNNKSGDEDNLNEVEVEEKN